MRIKIILTTLATLAAFVISAFSQNDFAPNAASGFSPFSMPQNLGGIINAAADDELPVIAPSGLSLYFTSARPGIGGRDIWVSQRATLSSAWGSPLNVSVLNTAANESPGHISPDGREMFFNSTRSGGIGGTDLWLSTRTDPSDDFGWTTPVNLGSAINTTFGEQNPNYFLNPVTGAGILFFSSDRVSGTPNVKDIYQSTRNPDGTFNPPVPVNELNSEADDNKTAITRDGLEIFFSSNRTGRAIFVSTRASVSAPWNPPVVVGGLSSEGTAAQPSLSPNGTLLYFASDRPGGTGGGDLYSAVRVSVNRTSTADFDGDGRADLSIFRPSDGTWHVLNSGTNTYLVRPFGLSNDKPAPGDYDGDGRTDFAIFRPSTGTWWISRSLDNTVSTMNWGISTDKPVPLDYDGDGRTDIAVYRGGTWYIVQSSTGAFRYEQFGSSSDIPVGGI
jgi:hypothetical protein